MCEFNRPYFMPSARNPISSPRQEIEISPQEEWTAKLEQLDEAEVRILQHAEQEAAALQSDVHIYRKIGSQFFGLAIEPGSGPTVKIWEHVHGKTY